MPVFIPTTVQLKSVHTLLYTDAEVAAAVDSVMDEMQAANGALEDEYIDAIHELCLTVGWLSVLSGSLLPALASQRLAE